jgi:hypothetical protein
MARRTLHFGACLNPDLSASWKESMKPYYGPKDGITIYHGDCIESAPWPDASVMVTDPPYGMEYVSGWSGNSVRHDCDLLFRDAALSAWGERPAIVFGRWSPCARRCSRGSQRNGD